MPGSFELNLKIFFSECNLHIHTFAVQSVVAEFIISPGPRRVFRYWAEVTRSIPLKLTPAVSTKSRRYGREIMQVMLAQPRGFCSGAIRAIRIVEKALANYGSPVYVLHEIVHNPHVVENLRSRGARFVESLEEIPEKSIVIFSAHGVSNAVETGARSRGLRVIDATCPLITRIHGKVRQLSRQGYDIIIVGHAGHPEIEGIRGRIEGPAYVLSKITEIPELEVAHPGRVAYVTQTTLSIDDTRHIIEALKEKFDIRGPDSSNICYATQARQSSVRRLTMCSDLLLVIGARNSSNSNRLREIGEHSDIPSYLIENVDDLDPRWFKADSRVGITAAASAPEEIVQDALDRLRTFYPCTATEMDVKVEKFVSSPDFQPEPDGRPELQTVFPRDSRFELTRVK